MKYFDPWLSEVEFHGSNYLQSTVVDPQPTCKAVDYHGHFSGVSKVSGNPLPAHVNVQY